MANQLRNSLHQAELNSTQIISLRFAKWIKTIPRMPKSMGIFSIQLDETLPEKYREVLEAELASALRKDKNFKLFFCYECQSPQLELKGDQILITKGVSEAKTFKDYAEKYDVESFALIRIVETALNTAAAVTLVDGATGKVIDSTVIRAPSAKLGNAAVHFMTQIGGGVALGGDPNTDSQFGGSFELTMLESLNAFKKFGYSLGVVYGKRRTFGYIAPTYAWKRQKSGLNHSLVEFGIGPGFATDGLSGLGLKFNYDYFIGSLFGIGGGIKAFAPIVNTDDDDDPLVGLIGINFIFNIGG